MGQGILYKYNHHLLVSSTSAVSVEKEEELVKSISELSLSEQYAKIIESKLPAFAGITNTESFDEYFNFDPEIDVDVNYDYYLESWHNDERSMFEQSLSSVINERFKVTSEKLQEKYSKYCSGDFDHTFNLTKICECMIASEFDSSIEIGVGTFADGDNFGIALYLESNCEIELEADTDDIKGMLTENMDNYHFIENLRNEHYTASDDIESIVEELDSIFRYWDDSVIDTVFGEENTRKMRKAFSYLEQLNDNEELDRLSEDDVKQYIELHSECVKYAVEKISNEASRIEGKYNTFAEELFNSLIESHPDDTFFVNAGNAWVARGFKRTDKYE